jgi:MOSC domain-containing protein YiiM
VCRFDGALYAHVDLLGSLRVAGARWHHHLDGLPAGALDTRPGGGWSAADHAARARDLTVAMADLLAAALDGAEPAAALDLPDPPAGGEPLGVVLDDLGGAATRLRDAASALDPAGWRRTAVLDGARVDAAAIVRRAVHATEHHTLLAGRAVRATGAGAGPDAGTVVRVNVSPGGVPKAPVEGAAVGVLGLEGDRQATRHHHGRPWQAVSLWSAERIDALRGEGHDLFPGAAGENLTVAGLDWAALRPGVQVQVGDTLLALSAFATPCRKIARWFTGGDPTRIHQARHPGWSRLYASVLRDGTVRPGDTVTVEP